MRLFWLTTLVSLLFCVVWAATGFGVSDVGILDTQNPSVSLIRPNNGETFYSSTAENILWYAGDSNLDSTCVSLWYSLDENESMVSISQGIPNTMFYSWDVPLVTSTSASVRLLVRDSFGNQTQDDSSVPFSILPALPRPKGLSISCYNQSDAQLSWQPVTAYADGTPVSPSGYLIMFCDEPNSDWQDYAILAETTETSYVHSQAFNLYPHRYYAVIAYLGGSNVFRQMQEARNGGINLNQSSDMPAAESEK